MTIVEFLTARLNEDEAVAKGVRPSGIRPWELMEIGDGVEYGSICIDAGRALAEAEAKRLQIAQTFRYEAKIDGEWACCHSADEIRAGVCTAIPVNEIETLRILAAVYADHPDYQPEWRPERPA